MVIHGKLIQFVIYMRFVLYFVLALVVHYGLFLDNSEAIQTAEGYGKSNLGQDSQRDSGKSSFQRSLVSEADCAEGQLPFQDGFHGVDLQTVLREQPQGRQLLPALWRVLGEHLLQLWQRRQAAMASAAAEPRAAQIQTWESTRSSRPRTGSRTRWTRPQVPETAEGQRERRPQKPQRPVKRQWTRPRLLQRWWERQEQPRGTSLDTPATTSSATSGASSTVGCSDRSSRGSAQVHGENYQQRHGLVPDRAAGRGQ